jgi:hypothetical protein
MCCDLEAGNFCAYSTNITTTYNLEAKEKVLHVFLEFYAFGAVKFMLSLECYSLTGLDSSKLSWSGQGQTQWHAQKQVTSKII